MKSRKLEYLRFDNPKGGILMAEKPYLILWGSNPVEKRECPFDHLSLLRILQKLRYGKQLPDEEKLVIVKNLSDNILREFFVKLDGRRRKLEQIDLVLNANELGLIPFELLLDDKNQPFFASKTKKLILTRRIRQDYFISKNENWPTVPKVLFAYANPNYGTFLEVPHQAHLESLNGALSPWSNETETEGGNSALTTLGNVSYDSLADTLQNANNVAPGQEASDLHPYTHLHILAHGALVDDQEIEINKQYGLALYSEQEKPTHFKKITDLIKSLDHKPFIVSYMVCDGANNANPISHERSIVQVTHEIGVPIVLGSQLPLTFEGSKQITKDFYNGIFSGKDVREVLHNVRCNLYDNKGSGHDWLSFVSYVRLPEGYEDYLLLSNLEMELAALKNIGIRTDAVIRNENSTVDDYEEIAYLLRKRIKTLLKQLDVVKKSDYRRGDFEENAGLLGSAYKRLAELTFHKNLLLKKTRLKSFKEQAPILNSAISWYKKAADNNLSHHWSVVQYLSLHSVLGSKDELLNYWHAALQSALNDSQNENEIWAFGSLAELYIQSPVGEKEANYQLAKEAIHTLVFRAKEANKSFAIESTRKQFTRYIDWWTIENGFQGPNNFKGDPGFNDILDMLK